MFHSSTNQEFQLGKNESDEMCLVKFDKSCEDQEEVMSHIVVSKIYKLPGHNQYTYEKLESLYKPKYDWLSAWKLRNHVTQMRKKILPFACQDSWFIAQSENDNVDDTKPAASTKTVTTTTNDMFQILSMWKYTIE